MLKILQARLQQYVNQERPDVQVGFRKGTEPKIKLSTSVRSYKKQENSRKTSTSASLTTLKPLTVWITTNWKILQEMGIPDNLICLLRSMYASQETTGSHIEQTGSKLGKENVKAVYCHPAYLTHMQSIMQNGGLDEAQAGIKIAGRNIKNIRYANDTTLTAESKEELKSLLMRVRKESEKACLNATFKKLRSWHLVLSFMTNRWVNNGNSERLYFLGLQNHCGW